MASQNNKKAAAKIPQNLKVIVATSFDNEGENSLYKRLERYTKQNGLGKPQDVVRLAVSKFLASEGV